MQIVVSGKFSSDVAESGRFCTNTLREIVERTDIDDVDVELGSLVFFPVILSGDLGISKKSHRSFSRKENAEFANVEIDHADWASATSERRLRLLVEGLTTAISESPRISSKAASEILHRLGVSSTN
jgi:hypothetical protein